MCRKCIYTVVAAAPSVDHPGLVPLARCLRRVTRSTDPSSRSSRPSLLLPHPPLPPASALASSLRHFHTGSYTIATPKHNSHVYYVYIWSSYFSLLFHPTTTSSHPAPFFSLLLYPLTRPRVFVQSRAPPLAPRGFLFLHGYFRRCSIGRVTRGAFNRTQFNPTLVH